MGIKKYLKIQERAMNIKRRDMTLRPHAAYIPSAGKFYIRCGHCGKLISEKEVRVNCEFSIAGTAHRLTVVFCSTCVHLWFREISPEVIAKMLETNHTVNLNKPIRYQDIGKELNQCHSI